MAIRMMALTGISANLALCFSWVSVSLLTATCTILVFLATSALYQNTSKGVK